MAYPTSLDNFTNPSPGDVVASALIGQMANAIEALELKVGTDGSSDPVSLDRRANADQYPADQGFLAWNYDPMHATSAGTFSADLLYVVKLRIPAGLVTNINMFCSNSAATTRMYGALYTAAGALVDQTPNQNGTTGTTGLKTWPLNTPQLVTSGLYYVGFWTNSTAVGFYRNQTSAPALNAGLGAGQYRMAQANAVATGTAPATIGAMTIQNLYTWVAVS